MDKFMTLTTLRRVVQIFSFVILVYGGYILNTFYLDEKFTNALPALSCAYDKDGADYCALIPLQHQFDHRVSGIFNGTVEVMAGLIPTFITLGTFFLLIMVINKAFCGWTCPLGFFQEVIGLIGDKLGIKKFSLSRDALKKVRPIKWVILVAFIFVFPILSGLSFMGSEFGDTFCKICPSRILTTLATGDMSQVYVDHSTTTYMVLSIIADLLFGLVVGLSLFVSQPFCRICPMLPLQSSLNKFALFRLTKNGSSKCDSCGNCVKACPMDIYEIQNVAENKNITHTDCTMCGRCVEFCPDDEVLSLKFTKFSTFSSSNKYFKKRNKIDKEWKK
jgi:polyferredoxin